LYQSIVTCEESDTPTCFKILLNLWKKKKKIRKKTKKNRRGKHSITVASHTYFRVLLNTKEIGHASKSPIKQIQRCIFDKKNGKKKRKDQEIDQTDWNLQGIVQLKTE